MWLGIALQLGGDDERADDTFVDMIDAATALEQWLAVSAGLAERAILAIERDDWVEAEALAERADSIVRRSRGEAACLRRRSDP